MPSKTTLGIAEHRVQRRPTDLREPRDLCLRDTGRYSSRCEVSDRGGLLGGFGLRRRPSLAMGGKGFTNLVHESSVKHLTNENKGRKVLYMETTTAQLTAQDIATEIRRYFSIGPRTRRYRSGHDLHADIFEAIQNENHYPGYYTERTARVLRPAAPILRAWDKFVIGCRLPGTTIYALTSLSPYKLAALIGRMVEAGITNNGEAECWFADHREEIEGWVA
jgi:hypothetical protein